ncbi:MAG: EAL domain-containing protein [Gammaproteobacteria bacterium]
MLNKSKGISRILIRTLLAVIALSILSFLYIQSQSFDHARNNKIIANIGLFKQLDTLLNQGVIKARSNLLSNYDPLVQKLARLHKLLNSFIEGPLAIYRQGYDDIDLALTGLSRTLQEKENLVEHFKSQNAVLTNSLKYLPLAINELVIDARATKAGNDLAILLTTLVTDAYIYNVNPSNELEQKIHNDLNIIMRERSTLSAEMQANLDTMAIHARTILTQKKQIDALTTAIVFMPSGKIADNLSVAYQDFAQERLRLSNIYRFYLYLFAILLLVFIGYILLRLRQTADALERDIAIRNKAELALFAEKERAQVTLESIGDAVITADITGSIEYINPVAQLLTGWSNAEARGLPLSKVFKVINEETRKPGEDPVKLVLDADRIVERSGHTVLFRRDGKEFAIEDSAAPIRDREGNIIGVVLVFHDVTQSRKMAMQLLHQASHDALTGLVNRREFESRLQRALTSIGKLKGQSTDNKEHTLLYIDLDQFKIVNDTCGHSAGDELLRRITSLLQTRVRGRDTLARLGGDEFGVLLERCPPESAARIAEELRQIVSDFYFTWQDKAFTISASIGLVNFSDDNLSLAEIMSAADTACYIAKDKGRNRVHAYYPEDSAHIQRQGEMEWVARIHKALEENRFCLYSQDVIPIRGQNESITRLELLLRMIDEDENLINPMAFIPAAERYNLMPTIDRWVIRTAFSHYARLRTTLTTDAVSAGNPASRERKNVTPMHTWIINLSGSSIGDEGFLEFVREQFVQTTVPHHVICFEITETAAITNLTKAVYFMEQLKALGCRFSLDDFGSGLASFAYLKHLPVDFLKIDGSFIKDMLHDPIDRAMVEAINNVGHIMKIQTIAESVEDEETLALLKTMGVDFAQGYGLARPKSFYEVGRRLPEYKVLSEVSVGEPVKSV